MKRKKQKISDLILIVLFVVAITGDPTDLFISLPLWKALGTQNYILLLSAIFLVYLYYRDKEKK